MICRNCGRLIRVCDLPAECSIGFVHVATVSHFCDDDLSEATPDPEV